MERWIRHWGVAALAVLWAGTAARAQEYYCCCCEQEPPTLRQFATALPRALTTAEAASLISKIGDSEVRQFRTGMRAFMAGQALARSASMSSNPYSSSMNNGGYATSYAGSPYPTETEIGGFLRGTADVVNSTGRFLIQRQEAKLLAEHVNSARIANRRRLFDQWLYEREKGPTWEEERQRSVQQWTSRSLNDPGATEVWSGGALNLILADIQRRAAKDNGLRGPHVPLDEDVLRRVNLSAGADGNAGLLKNQGRLDWPLVLSGEEFKADRRLLGDLVPEAINQVVNGRLDPGTIKDISAAADRMRATLRRMIRDVPTGQYIAASRFLTDLDDSIRVLQRPDAAGHFTRKYAAKGRDVAELVRFMTERGLRFAPAVAGDEAAYTAVHRALAAYHAGIPGTLVAEQAKEGG